MSVAADRWGALLGVEWPLAGSHVVSFFSPGASSAGPGMNHFNVRHRSFIIQFENNFKIYHFSTEWVWKLNGAGHSCIQLITSLGTFHYSLGTFLSDGM